MEEKQKVYIKGEIEYEVAKNYGLEILGYNS